MPDTTSPSVPCERIDDLPLLVARFCAQLERRYGLEDLNVDAEAIRWLQGQPWPGNVRQLRHVLERTVLLADAPRIDARSLAVEVSLQAMTHRFVEQDGGPAGGHG